MARIRTIKPDFMDSGSVKALSREARLFFLQLLTEVDDQGRFKYSPKKLAGVLYPGDDDVDGSDIERWTVECEKQGMIERYEVRDERFACVPNFLKHQVISKPAKSRIPEPEEHSTPSEQGVCESPETPRNPPGKSGEVREAQESPGTELGNGTRNRELGSRKGNASLPTLRESHDALHRPQQIAKAATLVLDQSHAPDEPKLTPRERKALRQPVEEWLDVGYDPEDIAKAIAASPYKTGAAVGGELRRHKKAPAKASPGDDALAAAQRFINRRQEA